MESSLIINIGHSGGLGDIIYSLRVIKDICGNNKCNLYIKRYNHYNNTCDNFEAIKDFLLLQPYINKVMPYSGDYPVLEWGSDIYLNYDLDKFRVSLDLFQNHIIKCTYAGINYEIPQHWNTPWVEIESLNQDYIVINRTHRYRKDNNPWYKLLEDNKSIKKYFIGLQDEFIDFQNIFNDNSVVYKKTNNLLEVFNLIKNSSVVWCNQSVCLTLAQSIGKKYYLEVAPNHDNTVRLFTQNENIME